MRRRAFLSALGASAGLSVAGTARAHPTASGGTPPDTTPHTHGPGPLGHISLPEAAEAVVDPDGTTVYVATLSGFAVIDVADPGAPEQLARVEGILADHEHGPMEWIQDVKVAGDRLLVVGPAHPHPVVAAAVLYDVSDPSNPDRLGVHETDYPIHNAFLTEDFAYLTGNGAEGNPLVILDGDAGLTERGRWSLFDADDAWQGVASALRVCHDVWVQDGRAYVAHWDAGTWIVDVSDPSSPSALTRVRGRDPEDLAEIQVRAAVQREARELSGNDHFVAVNDDGTLLGVGAEAWEVGAGGNGDDDGPAATGDGGPGGITLYDISDPTQPVAVARIDPPPTPDPTVDGVWTTSHNFELTAEHCYSSWYQGGVRVHDVSNPSNPEEVYAWHDASATRFWTARRATPGETFVASSMGVGDGAAAAPASTPTGTAGTANPADGADGEPALFVFPDPVAVETPASTATNAGDAGNEPTEATGPGLGPLAALAGLGTLGLGAWRRRQRDP